MEVFCTGRSECRPKPSGAHMGAPLPHDLSFIWWQAYIRNFAKALRPFAFSPFRPSNLHPPMDHRDALGEGAVRYLGEADLLKSCG